MKKLHNYRALSSVASNSLRPLDCSTPGFFVHPRPLEPIQTLVHWVSDAIQPSHPLSSPCPAFNLSQHQGLFQRVSSASGGQSNGVSASTSLLPMNTQNWSPSEWTGWISLQSKGLKSLLQHHSSKTSILWCSVSLVYDPTVTAVYDYWRNHSFDYMDLYRQRDVSALIHCLGLS